MRRAGGRCRLWAEKIREAMGGRLIHIRPKWQGRFIGPLRTLAGELICDNFEYHVAVRIGDTIYDRITGPAGLPVNEYHALFEWADTLMFVTEEEG
jgi:hypothetical protein